MVIYEEITEVVEDLDILGFLLLSDLVGYTSLLRYSLPLLSCDLLDNRPKIS